MLVTAAFPSNFLKADDLQNRRVRVIIESVEMEEMGTGGSKPAVHFNGKDRSLVLNKTNAAMIEEIAGTDEMDDWAGTEIVLYPTHVDFKGKRVPAIRVDYPTDGKPAPVAEKEGDDIPF